MSSAQERNWVTVSEGMRRGYHYFFTGCICKSRRLEY